MPVTVQPQYGSFVYHTSNCDGHEWEDDPSFRPVIVETPRSNVARSQDGYLGARRVRLKGLILGDGWSSRDDVRTALDAFTSAHGPGRRSLYKDSDRYLKQVQVERLTIGGDDGLLRVPYTIGFIAADPYYYSTTPATDAWSPKAIPNEPELTEGSGGTLAAATKHWVQLTWVCPSGETRHGTVANLTTSGASKKIIVGLGLYTAPAGVTYYNVYAGVGATEPLDSAKWKQNAAPVSTLATYDLTALLTSGTALSTRGELRSITNTGGEATPPKLTFTIGGSGGTLDLDLYNDSLSSNNLLQLDGAVSAADVLVVDCAAQTVTKNGSNVMSYFGGDFWHLATGANTLRLQFKGAPLASIVADWTPRWLS